jgi:hypothetical protein
MRVVVQRLFVVDGAQLDSMASQARKAVRVQRSRRKGSRMPPNTVYVGRPTKWGNPWSPKNSTHITMARGFAANPVESSRPMTVAECVEAYRKSIDAREFGYGRDEIRAELAGKNLACYCRLEGPCHADVLLEIANGRHLLKSEGVYLEVRRINESI